MLKKSLLAITLAFTLAAATGATAAPQQHHWTGTYNQTFADPPAEDVLFNRAKGEMD